MKLQPMTYRGRAASTDAQLRVLRALDRTESAWPQAYLRESSMVGRSQTKYTVDRLIESGDVEVVWASGEVSGPRLYALTTKGRKRLRAALAKVQA